MNIETNKRGQILGLDLGSRSVKAVLSVPSFDYKFFSLDTTNFYRNCGKAGAEGFHLDFTYFGIDENCILRTTGYGRNALNIYGADVVPEIQAHTTGAIAQTGLHDFVLLDLGGQDSKIIVVREGEIEEFFMNDRCAASSGRYIENMAAILGMTLEELSRHWENPEKLSSTCAVFGESELVSRLAKGADKDRLAAGVNAQVIARFAPKLDALNPKRIILVGGVALNGAIAKLLAMRYSAPVIIPKHPQHNGAIGLTVVQ